MTQGDAATAPARPVGRTPVSTPSADAPPADAPATAPAARATARANDEPVARWLAVVCGFIVFMIVFGGFVRLTESGLSIVEWNVVMGVLPPIGEAAWRETFARYQATPEFLHVNSAMTLDAYKRIFYIEYIHRLVARVAGLVVALPLLYFLARGIIPRRRALPYVGIGLLFAFQGFLGWYMVKSGLVDQPAVSHFRLTTHLLAALVLLCASFWQLLGLRAGPAGASSAVPGTIERPAARTGLAVLALLFAQIAYGGLVAGLDAGMASDTWPLMYGRWIPPGWLATLEPWWRNLVSAPATVQFVHRWLAFAVLAAAVALAWRLRAATVEPAVRRGGRLVLALVLAQIALGISVIWWRVPLVLALGHQALAVALLLAVVWVNFWLRRGGPPRAAWRHPGPQTAAKA